MPVVFGPRVDDRPDSFWRDERTVTDYMTSHQAVPLANEQFDAVRRVIAAYGNPCRTVLDLGSGDGITDSVIADAFAVEQLTLVDFSGPMLERAAERFAAARMPVDIVQADLGNRSWTASLPAGVARFDVVVSRFAIHHVVDERKREQFNEIHLLLAPGGLFINIEHVASASPVLTGIFDDLIIEGLIATSDGPLDWEDARAAYHGQYDDEVNYLAPVEDQCMWLRNVGFVDVDVVMKAFEIAVIVARKEDC